MSRLDDVPYADRVTRAAASAATFNHERVVATRKWTAVVLSSLGVTLFAVVLVGICAGQYSVSPASALRTFIDKLGGADLLAHGLDGGAAWREMDARIVTLVRGPRVLLAAACGAGLAVAGASLQGVFRNPLAAPEMLGVSAGAALGGAAAILLSLPGLLMIGSAFTSGMIALLIVGSIARVEGETAPTSVILAGVIVGAFFMALVSVTQLFADPHNSLPAITFWLMGSFASASWHQVGIALPAVFLGCVVLWLMRFRINALCLGEEEARTLGIPVERDRWLVFISVALIAAAVVSVAGIVGWVGIVIPHAARFLVGHDHRILLPASCLLGASYLCAVDTVARSATPGEIPVGVLTALIGAPFIAWMLRKALMGRGIG